MVCTADTNTVGDSGQGSPVIAYRVSTVGVFISTPSRARYASVAAGFASGETGKPTATGVATVVDVGGNVDDVATIEVTTEAEGTGAVDVDTVGSGVR